jgi:hypothetical protein
MRESTHHALVNNAEWRGFPSGPFASGRAFGHNVAVGLAYAECASPHGL